MIAWLSLAASAALPPPLASVAYAPPKVDVRKLSNGVPVLVLPRRPTGTFDVWLVARMSSAQDPVGAEGLASVALALSQQGAGDLDAAALASKTRAIGARLSTTSSGDWSAIAIHGLRDGLEPALDLWTSTFVAPTFSDSELELLRATRIQRVQLQVAEPAGAADRVQQRAMYGSGYLGRSPTEASLASLTTGQIGNLWDDAVGPANVAVVAGGDLTADELVPLLEARLGPWKGAERARVAATPVPVEREKIWVVDVKGAPQSAIRAFEATGSPDDPQRAAFDVVVDALGGGLASRMNADLREQKGWTYGARCNAPSRLGPLFLTCATLVRADVTGPALAEMRSILRGVTGDAPLKPDEVVDSRTSLLHSFPATHETVDSWLGDLADLWAHGRPEDWDATWLQRLSKVQPVDADQVARKWVVPDRLSWVVAGDLASIRPQLDALGIPVEVVTP